MGKHVDPFSSAGAGSERYENRQDAPGPRFSAQFSTVCPACGSEIEPGDDARMFEGQAHHDETYCLAGQEPDDSWRHDLQETIDMYRDVNRDGF